MDDKEKAAAFAAYVECALWASTDSEGEPLDSSYDPDDIDPGAADQMKGELLDFIALVDGNGIDASDWTPEQFGHDFWLTRNRHGAGFWDRGHGDAGRRLTELAHAYGSCDLYVSDNGKLYVA